jgi:hypothetical protein
MTFKNVAAVAAGFLMAGTMFGDGSYQKTTQVTGGPAMSPLIKLVAPFMPDAKHLTDPNAEINMVHGNRMVTVKMSGSTIWDIDKGTMTTTDSKKREYSVVTLQQMREMTKKMMSNTSPAAPVMPQTKSNPNDPKTTIESSPVSIQNTGAVKQFSGVSAKETVLTLKVTMKVTDPQSGQGVVSESLCYLDVWKADSAPGYDDVQDFYRRLGEKMGNQADSKKIADAMTSGPGAGGMSNVHTAANKIKGITVMEVERLSTLLGGRPLNSDSKQPLGVLTETTTLLSNFSNQPVVVSEFDVPAGYKEVPSPILQFFK